jgi:hypothetical protein
MNDMCTYLILLRGQIDASEINAMGPLQVTTEPLNSGATQLTVSTDQSGLIGLMRHLHGLGLVLESMVRRDAAGTQSVN